MPTYATHPLQPPRSRFAIALIAGLVLWAGPRAWAQVAPPPAAVPGAQPSTPTPAAVDSLVPTVLTVEGGGTLGVYEGGLTWALLESFRQRRVLRGADSVQIPAGRRDALRRFRRVDLRAVTGASAGSINAYLAAVDWCRLGPSEPLRESDFWLAWISLGLPELLPGRGQPGSDEKAIFTRNHFDSDVLSELHRRWDRRSSSDWSAGCHVDFAAPMTRVFADTIQLAKVLIARNQRYAAAFRITSPTGDARGPVFVNSPQSQASLHLLGRMLNLRTDSIDSPQISRTRAEDVIKASSGYPLAFQPYRVPACIERNARGGCAKVDSTTRFMDGGVFDNGPVTLGYGLLAASEAVAGEPAHEARLLYVSPDRRRRHDDRVDVFTAAASARDAEGKPEGLEAAALLLRNAVPSARQYELQVASRLIPSDIASRGHLSAFEREIARLRADSTATSTRMLALDAAQVRSRHDVDSLRILLVSCAMFPGTCTSPSDTDAARFVRSSRFPQVAQDSITRDSLLARYGAIRPAESVTAPLDIGIVPQGATTAPLVFHGDERTSSAAVTILDSLILGNSRWHPLTSSSLGGFAGVLGRPLREYDFLVGVYDGLSFMAELGTPDAIRPDSAVVLRRERLRGYLNPPSLVPLDTLSLEVLHLLFVSEFYPDSMPSDAEFFRTRRASGVRAETVRQWGVLQIARAMAARMRDTTSVIDCASRRDGRERAICERRLGRLLAMKDTLPKIDCTDGGALEQMSCNQGLLHLFTSLNKVEGVSRADSNNLYFRDFLDDPVSGMDGVASDFLWRLETTTDKEASTRIMLVALNAYYFAGNDRARKDWDAGTSLPPHLHGWSVLYLAVPSSIGGNLMGINPWVEWTPRWHASRDLAVVLPLRYLDAQVDLPDLAYAGRRGQVLGGVRLEAKLAGVLRPWLNTASVGADYVRRTAGRPYPRPLAFHASITPLLGKLRITAQGRPHGIPFSGERGGILWLFGVGDLNGDLYWLSKSLF
jgi:predicted acylesterase/phospholipase RssA